MANHKPDILVVDDDRNFVKGILEGLSNRYNVRPVLSIESAREKLDLYSFDLILLDLVFSKDATQLEGLDFLIELRENCQDIPVIVVTQHGNDENLIKAIQLGAVHYFRKESINYAGWIKVIDRHLKQKVSKLESKQKTTKSIVFAKGVEKDQKKDLFVGKNKRILEIKNELEILSEEPDISVLLLGETGVGKDVAARYLHNHGARKEKPFQAVSLVAVSKDLLESTLFGHKKGAFTGADNDYIGLFEQANGGILFLDEIGEISPLLQQKLLRVIENKTIIPIGKEEKKVDVQIVTATNRNLKEEVALGKFREDLYHRLNDYAIIIPPLRERKEDISIIGEYYLQDRGEDVSVFTKEVWRLFNGYSWPGNVRELISLIRRLLLKRRIAKVQVIDKTFLPEDFFNSPNQSKVAIIKKQEQSTISNKEETLALKTARMELAQIERALIEHKQKSKVVTELGFKHLDQLRYRIEKYYKEFPDLFDSFEVIRKKYKLYPK